MNQCICSKKAIKVNEEMMEKYGTKNSSPKVDGKRATKENDSARLMISINIIQGLNSLLPN